MLHDTFNVESGPHKLRGGDVGVGAGGGASPRCGEATVAARGDGAGKYELKQAEANWQNGRQAGRQAGWQAE